MSNSIEYTIAEKLPKMAERAKKSPLPAIRLFCLSCTCNQQQVVADCHIKSCFLHPFRKGKRPKSSIPLTERQKENRNAAGKRLAAMHSLKKADPSSKPM